MEEQTTQKNKTNAGRSLTGLNRFLCTVAGSDLNVLAQCPHEINRHVRIGAIIISTAFMASVSMFFAIQTVSQSTTTGLIAGVIWGLAIFILDSYIVSSYKKSDNWRKEFKIIFPRLVLALVLGCSISIPLELKVFESEIKDAVKLIEIERENEKKDSARKGYEKDIAPYIQEKKSLQADNDKQNAELAPFTQKVNKLENDLADEIGGKGRTKKRNYGPVAKTLDGQLQAAKRDKQTRSDVISPQVQGNNNRIAQLDSLIARVKQKPVENAHLYGLSAQMDGLKKLTSSNSYVLFAYWIFFALILGIETAPIFVKFFTPKGSYDHILAMNEYVLELKQKKRQSDLHELINAELDAIRSVNTHKKEAQEKVNQELMIEIANAQGEIATRAIQAWKSRQLALVDEDPGSYISTIPTSVNHQPVNIGITEDSNNT